MNCIKSIRQTDVTNHEAFISEPMEQSSRFVLYRDRKPQIVLINDIKFRLKTDSNTQYGGQNFTQVSKDKRTRWRTQQNKQVQQLVTGKESLHIHNFQPFKMHQKRINNSINRRRDGSLQVQRKKLEFALKNRKPTFFSNAITDQLLQKSSNARLFNLGMINNSYIFLSRQQAKANLSLKIHPIHRKQLKKGMVSTPSESRDFFKFPKISSNNSDLSHSKIH